MTIIKTTRNILLFVLTGIALLFLFSKIKSVKDHSLIDNIEVSELLAHLADSTRNKNALDNLVYSISTETTLEDKYIGIEGRKSTQPDYVKLLGNWGIGQLTANWSNLPIIIAL